MNDNNFKQCKYCGAKIAKNAKVCPQCGGRNGVSVLKVLLIIAAIFVFFFIGLLFLGACLSGNSYTLSEDAALLSEDDYKALCVETTYDDLARNADSMVGEKVVITGEIETVEYDGEIEYESEYTVSVTKDEYDLYDIFDCVYLYYCRGIGSKLLEGDIITIYGEVSGYTDYLGKDIPVITAAYVSVNDSTK